MGTWMDSISTISARRVHKLCMTFAQVVQNLCTKCARLLPKSCTTVTQFLGSNESVD